VVRYWCGYLPGFAYGPSDAIATLSSVASLKSTMAYLLDAGLPRMSGKKRPLNGCSGSLFVGNNATTC